MSETENLNREEDLLTDAKSKAALVVVPLGPTEPPRFINICPSRTSRI